MTVPWQLDVPRYGNARRLRSWLDEQLSKCTDRAFGRQFAATCPVPGKDAADYLHRMIAIGGATLLAGIRFKGGDVTQPFVDLLAWAGEPSVEWLDAIAAEFSQFRPQAVRSCWSEPATPPWPGEVDQYVYAGPAAGRPQEDVAVPGDLSWFDAFQATFEQWRRASELGPEVFPAERDELESCLDKGRVVVARRDGAFAGVAACNWAATRAFEGWSMLEQFVVPEFQGQGLGIALQRSLMHWLPQGDLVWGTIHGRNAASQATATRCGRRRVETWWFTPLDRA